MKKIGILFLLSFMFCGICYSQNTPAGYVDLGLPSGTLWKQKNESNSYTYSYAIRHFDGFLPTSGQFQELIDYCTWEWTGKGYNVIGKNKNHIFLLTDLTDEELSKDKGKGYWSVTKDGDRCCYGLLLFPRGFKVDRTCNLNYERRVVLCIKGQIK